ncbi:MAG: SPFH domain-containing protein [Nocardiaceae bacterium]|nr:SPFH domain-containing protein [Nocardiaceae bacterium]
MGFEKLIDLVVQFLEFFRFCTIIDCYERGVRLRFGKFVSELEPGLRWQWPFFIDNILNENVVPKLYQLFTQSIMTRDGVSVAAGAVICYQIRDIKKALLEVDTVANAIHDSCASTMAEEILAADWADVRAAGFSDKLTAACRKRGFRYGVEVMSVRFNELAPVRNYRTITGN